MTRPQGILKVYYFLLSDKYNLLSYIILSYIKNVLALPSFIMAVNVCRDIEAQKSASIIHKKCSTRLCGLIKY